MKYITMTVIQDTQTHFYIKSLTGLQNSEPSILQGPSLASHNWPDHPYHPYRPHIPPSPPASERLHITNLKYIIKLKTETPNICTSLTKHRKLIASIYIHIYWGSLKSPKEHI